MYHRTFEGAANNRQLDFTQLFVNGKRQQLARYPNPDNSNPEKFSGYATPIGGIADDVPSPCPEPDEDMTFSSGAPRGIEFDPSAFTDKRWAKPDEATIHIFQSCHSGNLQWRVKDIDWNQGRIWFAEGGHQMGAKWYHEPCVLYPSSQFFVENVFEELDAPGEWYLNRDEGILYLYPEPGVDLQAALVEVPVLEQIIRIVGSQAVPVRHVSFRGLRFAHTTATFMNRYEIPSLGDWAICRSGAVFLEGTRECAIQNCLFDAPGGNAVFVNCYNRDAVVSGNTFERTGDSAICFVGKLETTMDTQYTLIAPPVHTPWLETIDNNSFHSNVGEFIARVKSRGNVGEDAVKYSLEEWQALGYDKHSLFADPLFVDVANLDFRVKPQSPALKLGFKNFEMNEWGLMPDFRAWA